MDRIFTNNIYRILELFMQYPGRDFSARGIARSLELSHATVLKHIDELEKQDLVRKKTTTLYPAYYANAESEKLRFYKQEKIVYDINGSGLTGYLQKKLLPSSIVLFGSCAKGTYDENSDIDIFVEAGQAVADLGRYEKKLRRKINIIFEQRLSSLSIELRNNIINGVILYGFMRI